LDAVTTAGRSASCHLDSGTSAVAVGDEDAVRMWWVKCGPAAAPWLKTLSLKQAARAPHHDLSGAEVEAAQRLSEHLLHLQRLQRRGLAAAAERHGGVASLAAGLAELAAAPDALPAQVAGHHRSVHTRRSSQVTMTSTQNQGCAECIQLAQAPCVVQSASREWAGQQRTQLNSLLPLVNDTHTLLVAAADTEANTAAKVPEPPGMPSIVCILSALSFLCCVSKQYRISAWNQCLHLIAGQPADSSCTCCDAGTNAGSSTVTVGSAL
jgi:hypothetical protein